MNNLKKKFSKNLGGLYSPKIPVSISRLLDDEVDLCNLLSSLLSIPNLDVSAVTPVIAMELSVNEEYGGF